MLPGICLTMNWTWSVTQSPQWRSVQNKVLGCVLDNTSECFIFTALPLTINQWESLQNFFWVAHPIEQKSRRGKEKSWGCHSYALKIECSQERDPCLLWLSSGELGIGQGFSCFILCDSDGGNNFKRNSVMTTHCITSIPSDLLIFVFWPNT